MTSFSVRYFPNGVGWLDTLVMTPEAPTLASTESFWVCLVDVDDWSAWWTLSVVGWLMGVMTSFSVRYFPNGVGWFEIRVMTPEAPKLASTETFWVC